jgi:hypothetical protein
MHTCIQLTVLVGNVTVGDSITKVTNNYIAAMITNIHFLVAMFTLNKVTNAPIFTSYHCPLVAMDKEHARRVSHCLSFSTPQTQNNEVSMHCEPAC